MITFTRCAFIAKQACATFSQVVQKITPPIANNFLKFFFVLFAILTLNAATAWAETTTYTFNSKSWGDSSNGWISGKEGNQFTSNQGVQVTTGTSGANATTKNSFTNVSSIAVQYCTNSSKGKGSISIQVGENTAKSFSVSAPSSNGTTLKTKTFTFNPNETGKVKISVTCATNSVYIYKVTINTVDAAPSCDKKVTLTKGSETNGTFTLDKANGSYDNCDEDFVVKVSNVVPTSSSQYCSGVNVTGGNSTVTGPVDGVWTVTYAKGNNITSTITPTFADKTSATITISEAGATFSVSGKYVGDSYTLPSTSSQACGDKKFVGWSTEIIENSATKPTAATYFEPGASVTLAASQTFYAVFAETGGTPTTSWPKTDVSDLKAGDEVVLVMNNGSNYTLNDDNGTDSAPNATSINIENDCLKDSPIAANLSWILGKDGNNLTFYQDATEAKWLYCTNANNGVRVGTNANKVFTLDTSNGYLKNTGTSRYIGIYNSQDWRCYTSTTTNIGNQTLAFYKKTTTGGYQNYTTECSTPTEFTVSFDANGHGTAPDAQIVASGQQATEPTPAPTATGYTFGGWYKESECKNKFDFNTAITADITLYAKWTAIQTTITLNANGGSGNTTSVAATYDSSTLNPSSITNPTKTGHTFGGWYSGEGGTGSLVINSSGKLQANVSGFTGTNGVWKATTNKTLYAKWTPTVYAINYKDQGGANFSGQHEAGYPQNHTYNTATTLKSASKNHYTFDGWYKENDCSGTAVTTLGATEYTDNITLYAKWTAKTYTITLDANGGTFVDKRDSQTKGSATFDYIYGTYATYNDAPNLTEYYSDLKRDGYQFDKWVSAGSPWKKLFTSTGDRTIQAQWSKLYTITLSENGTPTEPTTQTSTTYKLPVELTAGSCQDDTKELVGWSTVAIPTPGDMPTSDFYKKGETVTLSKDKTTFYAVFATVDGGGATDNTNVYTSNVSINAGTAITNTSVVIDQEEYNATKAGTGSANGSVLVTIPAGTTYLSFYMAGWRGEGDKTITLTGAEAEPSSFKTIADNGVTGNGNYELEGNVAQYAYSTTLNNVTQETQITFSNGGADQRFVIWGVNASAGATYSNYSTTCVPAPKLVSITQTAGQTEFTEGDEFVKATITATYDDESTKDVTSKATFSTPDMTQVGEKTISVSYKEGEVTAETSYKINIKEKTKYTINWWANGEKYHTQTAVEGTAIDVPASSDVATYACDDKVFVGWVDAEIIGSTNTEPTFITEFGEIEGDKAFFAVFATETSAGIESTIHTLTPSNSWSGYKEGSITDDKGYTWSYNAAGQSTDGVYSLNLRNKDTETSYIGSPLFTANVKNIKATIVNGSASKARKVYVCSAPTLEPTTGDLGITEVAGGHSGELSLAFEGTISQFYLQVSDALQFQSIVVEVGATTTYSGYVTTCEASTETLSGKFSTGKYEYAEFATGNLQYKPSTDTWRFAKQQYQYVGEANINVGDPNYKGWIDMFGWSADGKFGVNPSCNKELYTGDFVDWGTQIGEGWLTLTETQWNYLLNTRPNHSTLKQIAMVGETRGIILFPDNWTGTTVEPTYDDELKVYVYKYNLVQWADLEAKGVIFLPAAGRRFGGYGNTYGVDGTTNTGAEYKIQYKTNYFACYWTSTKHNDAGAASYLFNYATSGDSYKYSNLNLGWYEYGHAGHSVRLAKVTSTLVEIGSDDNREVIEANAGQKVNVQVNRTFKANDGYYTICLPFDLDAEKIGKALQISSITENVAEQGMNVVFTEVTNLVAGQPYLLLPSEDLTNPIFENVEIVNTTGDTTEPVSGAGIKITLTGIINRGGQTDGSTEYYVGDYGYLYNGPTAKLGLRAFFTITDDADQPVKVRARVVVGENTTTGVDNSQLPITNIQKVIENGQLIIIRNGEKFNAQGQKL